MNSKEKIANTLIELMKYEEYEKITIKDISDSSKINRSTYYRNFKSKEDIIKYKLELIMDEFIATYKAKNIQKKEEYIITILETFYKYKDFFIIIHKEKQIYLLQKVLVECFKYNIDNCSKKELYHVYYHIGGIYNFTVCWIENEMEDDPKTLTKIATDIVKYFNPLLWSYI